MIINVLTNFYGGFNSSYEFKNNKKLTPNGRYRIMSMDLERLKFYAEKEGLELNFIKYSKVLEKDDLQNQLFVYTSSEDRGLIYKGYFEDIAYALYLKGAKLIPDWRYLRAHHNKAMMEILRDINLTGVDTGIHSRIYGCNEEFLSDIDSIDFPCVYKSAEGAGSKGVALLKSREQAVDFVEKNHINHKPSWKEKIQQKTGRTDIPVYSNYRNKFVIQNFVSGLSGDFKVLVFGDKYYALSRKNRDNDFRASGGGKLNFEPEIPEGFFDFVKSIYDALNVPVLSLDVAFDGNKFYLIEFQCLYFGTSTLVNSTHYYKLEKNRWVKYDGKSVLEEEYTRSLKRYIEKNNIFDGK